jgi:hypothetical protein
VLSPSLSYICYTPDVGLAGPSPILSNSSRCWAAGWGSSSLGLSFSVVLCFWFTVSILIIFKRKTHIIMHHCATYDNVRAWPDVLFIREIKSVHWRWFFVHTLMASRLQICIEICLIIHLNGIADTFSVRYTYDDISTAICLDIKLEGLYVVICSNRVMIIWYCVIQYLDTVKSHDYLSIYQMWFVYCHEDLSVVICLNRVIMILIAQLYDLWTCSCEDLSAAVD